MVASPNKGEWCKVVKESEMWVQVPAPHFTLSHSGLIWNMDVMPSSSSLDSYEDREWP